MIYLSSFQLSEKRVTDPNIYPYSVFRNKDMEPFVFRPITVLYGNNGSGKSTVLNVMAECLGLPGWERATSNKFGRVDYCGQFSGECSYTLGEDEDGRVYGRLLTASRYIKSEDILYEIKKIQQRQVLGDGMVYDLVKRGRSRSAAEEYLKTEEGARLQDILEFAQEKYSNGETALQYLDEYLRPDALYLLDEPEVSLSSARQVELAEQINQMARFLNCQFIIATHSPFMLGTLNAKIYNMDTRDFRVQRWSELENVRFLYEFFKKKESEFL